MAAVDLSGAALDDFVMVGMMCNERTPWIAERDGGAMHIAPRGLGPEQDGRVVFISKSVFRAHGKTDEGVVVLRGATLHRFEFVSVGRSSPVAGDYDSRTFAVSAVISFDSGVTVTFDEDQGRYLCEHRVRNYIEKMGSYVRPGLVYGLITSCGRELFVRTTAPLVFDPRCCVCGAEIRAGPVCYNDANGALCCSVEHALRN